MKNSADQSRLAKGLQVYNGLAGLNIPELPENASDEAIFAALTRLDEAEAILTKRQKALAKEAIEVSNSIGSTIAEEQALLQSSLINRMLKESKKGMSSHTAVADL